MDFHEKMYPFTYFLFKNNNYTLLAVKQAA
jgi:hypothetical protein